MGIHEVQPRVHSNTFQMNFLGLLRLYRITGDASILRKVKGAWDDVASRQMYITGGVSVDEYYRHGYIRPITGDVIETCATMTWLELTQSLLELTGDVRYADVVERLLFNQVFASQTVDGDGHRVNTPLNGSKPEGYFRRPERPCDCCTSSGHRLISMLPRSFYAQDRGGLFVNQFVPSTADFDLSDGTAVTVEQDTGYPESDTITIRVNPAKPSRFALRCPGPRLVRAALGRRQRRAAGRGEAGIVRGDRSHLVGGRRRPAQVPDVVPLGRARSLPRHAGTATLAERGEGL